MAIITTSSPRRSGRFRKPCSYKDYEVKILNYSTEAIIPERLVYQVNKNYTEPSRQFPRVLVSFATAIEAAGNSSNKNMKESCSFVPHVTPDQMTNRQGEDAFVIISGSEMDEIHARGGSETKKVEIINHPCQQDDSGNVISSNNTDKKSMTVVGEDCIRSNNQAVIKKHDVVVSNSKGRYAIRQRTAATALNKGLPKIKTIGSITTRRSKSPLCQPFSKKIKVGVIHNKNKKNRLKEETVKMFKLHTGTLYLYRGLNPRAEFVHRR